MKITKYLVLAALLIIIGKKTVFTSEINANGNITEQRSSSMSGGWITNPDRHNSLNKPTIHSKANDNSNKKSFTVNLPNSKTITGKYNSTNGTATINFKNVITTSQSTTPPSVSNPNYTVIGYMINPKHHAGTQNISGGESAKITLWGIQENDNNSKITKHYELTPSSEPITNSSIKKYLPATKTATMQDGSVYVGVIEYTQSVTPPNIAIPALQAFATIKNPKKLSSVTYGAPSTTITLWGLKVIGHRISIKTTDKKQIIGYFWPESNIAQLNNGQTIVGIMKTLQGNYKKHGAYATGPAWTQYSDEQISALKREYTITPSHTNVFTVGMVTINGQKYLVQGINLSSLPKHSKNETFSSGRKE